MPVREEKLAFAGDGPRKRSNTNLLWSYFGKFSTIDCSKWRFNFTIHAYECYYFYCSDLTTLVLLIIADVLATCTTSFSLLLPVYTWAVEKSSYSSQHLIFTNLSSQPTKWRPDAVWDGSPVWSKSYLYRVLNLEFLTRPQFTNTSPLRYTSSCQLPTAKSGCIIKLR